jgi:hypothetical protein
MLKTCQRLGSVAGGRVMYLWAGESRKYMGGIRDSADIWQVFVVCKSPRIVRCEVVAFPTTWAKAWDLLAGIWAPPQCMRHIQELRCRLLRLSVIDAPPKCDDLPIAQAQADESDAHQGSS